jgi:hypothetical protein
VFYGALPLAGGRSRAGRFMILAHNTDKRKKIFLPQRGTKQHKSE